MGGSAFLIHGEFDADRAAQAAAPPSFFDRLRGRQAPALSTTRLPNGRSLLQFPPDAIAQALAADYLAFVRERLTPPSPASRVVLEYLALGQPTIYLRADRGPGETAGPWYVQISFSGAAGMCETSARVAAHWAARWFASRGDAIRIAILAPNGFTVANGEPIADAIFVPTPQTGYAERDEGIFTIDASVLEGQEDPETLVQALARDYGPAFDDGACHCQMCPAP
jgi:hypothetical protein